MTTKKYVNDYEVVTTLDEAGREKQSVVYRGLYFEVSLSSDELSRFRMFSILLTAAAAALHISSGFLQSQGMFRLYISLPYVISFFPLLLMVEGIFRLPREKRSFRRDEMELSFRRLKRTSLILLILLAAAALGQSIFLLFTPPPVGFGVDLLYLAMETAAAAAVLALIRLQKNVHLLPETNPGEA